MGAPRSIAAAVTIAVLAGAGCGRIGFDAGMPCDNGPDCESGQCVTGVCCDTACTGTCARCVAGTCVAVPAMCTGDCAACVASGDGFSCAADATACASRCSSATCAGAGTAFACDMSSCCATSAAPNFTGACSTAVDVVVGSGCRLEYDYNTCCTGAMYREVTWDVEECQAGAWVSVDSGADAFPCTGCPPESRDFWTDTCGDHSAANVTCP